MDSKEFRKARFTLKGRMFYPKLETPEVGSMGGRSKYSILFAWPITDPAQAEVMKKLNAHLVAAKNDLFGKIPVANLQLPIKKWGVYQRKDGSPNAAFLEDCYWMNMSSGEAFKPTVVDQNKSAVIEPSEIYSGRNIAVAFSFYDYSNQNFGMAANLNAVMLLGGGEQIAAGGVNLTEAFGSFVDDTAGAATESGDSESLI